MLRPIAFQFCPRYHLLHLFTSSSLQLVIQVFIAVRKLPLRSSAFQYRLTYCDCMSDAIATLSWTSPLVPKRSLQLPWPSLRLLLATHLVVLLRCYRLLNHQDQPGPDLPALHERHHLQLRKPTPTSCQRALPKVGVTARKVIDQRCPRQQAQNQPVL